MRDLVGGSMIEGTATYGAGAPLPQPAALPQALRRPLGDVLRDYRLRPYSVPGSVLTCFGLSAVREIFRETFSLQLGIYWSPHSALPRSCFHARLSHKSPSCFATSESGDLQA